MSAALKPVEDVRINGKTYEAAVILLEEQEGIIRGLKAQNRRLAEEKLQAELAASLELAKHRFTESQLYQRLLRIEESVKALDEAQNRTGNIVQGLPTRAEFTILHDDYYTHSANCS